MPINKNELTKEQIEKAMQCKTADDLMAYAKSEGIDITREEAEAYFAELADVELDGDVLKSVADLNTNLMINRGIIIKENCLGFLICVTRGNSSCRLTKTNSQKNKS